MQCCAAGPALSRLQTEGDSSAPRYEIWRCTLGLLPRSHGVDMVQGTGGPDLGVVPCLSCRDHISTISGCPVLAISMDSWELVLASR